MTVEEKTTRFKDFFRCYKWTILASMAIDVFIAVAWRVFSTDAFKASDFSMYYEVSRSGLPAMFSNIYDTAFWDARGLLEYRYFPAFLAMIYPLTYLPLPAAFISFFCLNAVLLVLSTWMFMSMFIGGRDIRPFPRNVLVFAMMVVLGQNSLYWGQPSAALLFLTICSLRFFSRGKDEVASLLLGITLVIKPVMIALVFLVLLKQKSKFLKRAIFVCIPLIPDAIIFISNTGLIRGFIQVNTVEIDRSSYRMFSVSFMNILAMLLQSITAVQVLSLCICLLFGVLMQAKGAGWTETFAFGSFVFIIVFPDVWYCQLLFVIPFLLLKAKDVRERRFALVAAYVGTALSSLILIAILMVSRYLPGDSSRVTWSAALENPFYVSVVSFNAVTCSLSIAIFVAYFVPWKSTTSHLLATCRKTFRGIDEQMVRFDDQEKKALQGGEKGRPV